MFKAGLTAIIGALVFQTGALAQIYVKNPGNVGIGVANPDFKLQVSGFTEIGDNTHDPTKYGMLQLTRPANQGDEKFHLSFIRGGNAIAGMGYSNNSNLFGIWVSPPQGTYSTPTIGFDPNGNVGIGTSTPADKLHVMGNLRLSAGSEFYFADNGQIRSLDDNHRILFRRSENKLELREYGNIIFSAGAIATAETATMVVNSNGNVGIGTINPANKLQVVGTIRTTQIVADAGNTWPDYVFDSNYQLPSLTELKNYIKQNHHLPDVPSEEEVKKDGVNISNNQAILLKKIEELTLYVIEQNEKLTELAAENATIKESIKELKTNSKRTRK